MLKQIVSAYSAIQNSGLLIHCITNPISINQCANAVLAVGCKPIMAEHPREVRPITASADALLLNLGNITDARRISVTRAAAAAKRTGTPVVLDAVGVACSVLRRNLADKIIQKYTPAVIKGNYSEINALYQHDYHSAGVDADADLCAGAVAQAANAIARAHRCVVLASGKTDILTDGKQCLLIGNGTEQLARVTGTGCMLGALTACFLPCGNALYAAVIACGIMGIAGELAQNDCRNGSFMVGLLDGISAFQADFLQDKLNLEVR